ncbi:MAG: hypothetical protein F6K19_29960 [Cyanothece sp. SIO1E1]|nr:hypothetical protein [Cyanothece sp. SIO1E1]
MVRDQEVQEKQAVADFLKYEFWPQLQEKTECPYQVIAAILAWTESQTFLTRKLCQLVCADKTSPIVRGKATSRITQLVRTYFHKDTQDLAIQNHFKGIQDSLLQNDGPDRLWCLIKYRQIWQNQELSDDGSFEHKKLLDSGIIAERDGKLRVHNSIYKSVFNLSWLALKFSGLRPYTTQKLVNWLESNQHESHLLRGQELAVALEWAYSQEGNLPEQEYDFLSESKIRHS